jgi:purine-binding chemotaxis protein CheW
VSDDLGLIQLCVVRIGSESYALDLKRVEEILPVPVVTPLPKAPRFLEGVARLRKGEVLPVIDARKRLGVLEAAPPSLKPSGKPRKTERLMVCRIGTRRLGVLVDAVTQVQRVTRASLRPAPLSHRPGSTPHVLGVVGDGERLTLLLDVKALLTEDAS